MASRTRTLVVAAAVVLAVATALLAGALYWRAAERPPAEGGPVPDVSVRLLDGGEASLRTLRGQVVLVGFWATWCPSCRDQLAAFQRVWEARRDDGFTVLALSTDDLDPDQIRWWLEPQGIGYPVGLATESVVAAFGGAGLPVSFLVDAEGRIRRMVPGVYDPAELIADVDGLLREAGRAPAADRSLAAELEGTRPSPSRWLDVEGAGYVEGAADAPVTVVEFSDYGCGYCSVFARETFPVLRREFVESGRVRWVHVPLVLGRFPNSAEATLAAACAAEQSEAAYRAVHTLLFQRQAEWRRPSEPLPVFRRYVEEAGGDPEPFARCYRDRRPEESLERARRTAAAAGVGVAPTFFVNGERAEGALELEAFRRLIEAAR